MMYYNVELNLPKMLGDNLKRLREKQGFTQESLAERIGVDDRTLRRWEGGGITRVDVIADVAAALALDDWRELLSDGDELPPYILIDMKRPHRADSTCPSGGVFFVP